MKTAKLHGLLLAAACSLTMALSLPMAGGNAARLSPQAGAASSGNLYKELMAHKDTMGFKPAPDGAIPNQVCTLLQICDASVKFYSMGTTKVNGSPVGRGVFLTKTQDAKHVDVVLLAHQSLSDFYFFQVAPDGTLLKSAYGQQGKPWMVISNSLAQPAFEQDKKDWLSHISKVTAPPAAH